MDGALILLLHSTKSTKSTIPAWTLPRQSLQGESPSLVKVALLRSREPPLTSLPGLQRLEAELPGLNLERRLPYAGHGGAGGSN